MEHLAWYELLLLFFAASFLGWVLETATADIKQKKFVNRGLVTGPFCVMYGITTVLLTVGLGELRGIWLFLFSAIYATVVESSDYFTSDGGTIPAGNGIWTAISA